MALNSFRKVTPMFYPQFLYFVQNKKYHYWMGEIFMFITKQRAEQLIKQMEQCFLKEFKAHKNSSESDLKQQKVI